MYVREIGEFALIARLAKQILTATSSSTANGSASSKLIVTIGDDTAAWIGSGETELLTTDTVVEGVHFTPETSTWQTVGWKGLTSNLSDISSMGGIPTYAVVSLGLPRDTLVLDVENLYIGLLEAANTFGITIVGGDIVASPVFFMTIAQTGITQHAPMLRSEARPGDQIAVTGPLGGSAAGLAILLGEITRKEGNPQPLIDTHQQPRPRIKEGQALVKAGVTCATDVSDGLLINLGTICASSGHAAHVDTTLVPIHPEVTKAFPKSALSMALNGGEDYELLFTASPDIMTMLQDRLEHGLHVIGMIMDSTPSQVYLFDENGEPVELPDTGWDHFRR